MGTHRRLTLVGVAVLLLGACTSLQDAPDDAGSRRSPSPRLWATGALQVGAAGLVDERRDVDVAGTSFGGRSDLTVAVAGGYLEVGFELGARGFVLDSETRPAGIPIRTEITAAQLVYGPTALLVLAPRQTVSPYAQAAAGWHRTDITAQRDGVGTSTTDDSGAWLALGGGLLFRPSDAVSILVGGVWERSTGTEYDADLEAGYFTAGVRTSF